MWGDGKFYNRAASSVSSKIFTTRCKLLSTDYRAIQVNKFYMINHHHQHHQSASQHTIIIITTCH